MNIYRNNIQELNAKILTLDKVLNRLSILRLVTFILSATLILILANERLLTMMFIAFPICVLGFSLLVKRFNEVDHLKRHTKFLQKINEGEVLRLENKLSGFPTGQEFIDRDHPYVSDLDIFGQHSLFQLINRTSTESGNIVLAKWLSTPAATSVIYGRQAAVKELSLTLDWRQDFQATGMHFTHTRIDYDTLLAMVEKPVKLLPHQSKYLFISVVLSILSTAAAIYFFKHVLLLISIEEAFLKEIFIGEAFITHIFPFLIPLIITVLVNALVLRMFRSIAEEITEKIRDNIRILTGYQSLISKIKSENFISEILQKLQSTLTHDNYSVANKIKELTKILVIFQLRGRKREFNNLFYSFFNVLWFLDVYLIILTEKWKRKNGSYFRVWASAVHEFEGLNSLAGFHYSNPTFIFPEIKEDPFNIRFEMLGHPLIIREKRVCNDFSLNGRGAIAIITGSNMAGKSTFLRTVGINMVIALMGGPCCAKTGMVSNINIFSSMRTQDSLEEGVSSFYAELKRVEHLLKLIESGQRIFFLLDEMFKGTNSKDRHKGGFSLIKQLKDLNAFGLISTHDLDLATLTERHMLVTNYSFNSIVRDDELYFNYQLNEGLCRDFNASELMKKSGIKVLSNIEEI